MVAGFDWARWHLASYLNRLRARAGAAVLSASIRVSTSGHVEPRGGNDEKRLPARANGLASFRPNFRNYFPGIWEPRADYSRIRKSCGFCGLGAIRPCGDRRLRTSRSHYS